MEKGILIVLSGPSGAGKGTVVKELRKAYSNLAFSVSVTTRQPRDGEINGVNYHFKTLDEYKEILKEDGFLETEEVFGNYYGTLKSEVFSKLDKGFDVMLEIDVKGAMKVKEQYKDVCTIFICPNSNEVLKSRLAGRGSESEETFKVRCQGALGEIKQAEKYDYIVINEDIVDCKNDILAILKKQKGLDISREDEERVERCLSKNNKDFIERLTNGGI